MATIKEKLAKKKAAKKKVSGKKTAKKKVDAKKKTVKKRYNRSINRAAEGMKKKKKKQKPNTKQGKAVARYVLLDENGRKVGGRPGGYNSEYHDDHAYKFCLMGATDKELAVFFEIEYETLQSWKQRYPTFAQAIRAGREIADSLVAESLYERAKGYSHDEDKVFCNSLGDVTVVPTTRHYPPDTHAAVHWLNNRQQIHWKNKDHHEIAGEGGGPIETITRVIVDPKKVD